MNELYHGTLAQNIESIRKIGLLPRRGSWTAGFHSNASELVYAVDESRRGRIIVAITGQMAKADLVRWSDDYQINHFNNDLAKHGAVVVIRTATFRSYPGSFESGHPPGTEPGDWYSCQSVGVEEIQGIMIGQEMLSWLQPHEMDFAYRYSEILRTSSR
jgi:hypothetical protein